MVVKSIMKVDDTVDNRGIYFSVKIYCHLKSERFKKLYKNTTLAY